jgi:hypothetical protein
MRILFALLMCLVFGAAQCFAIKGGPPYPGGGTNIRGTFAGVMQGAFDPTNPASSNTLGLFTLSVPQTGLATGVVLMFVAGRAFTGTISGVGDPNKASLRGVMETTIETTLVLCSAAGSPVSGEVTDHADGNIEASFKRTAKAITSVAGTLLTGTALITATQTTKNPSDCTQTIQNSSSIILLVDGFKQSNS